MFEFLSGLFKPKPKPGSRAWARDIAAQAHEAYKLARRDRPQESHQPHAYSGDSAIIGSHDLMNRRVRDIVRNTAQGKRIQQAMADLVVGTGIQTFAWPFAPQDMMEAIEEIEAVAERGRLSPKLRFALESDDEFQRWAEDKTEVDVEGRLNWSDMQRMLLGEACQVGNGFLVRSMPKDYKTVPLRYQMMEREQLDETLDRPASDGENRIVGGIELDASNRVIAYHFWKDHPHEFFGTVNSVLSGAGRSIAAAQDRIRIPAERVIDLALYSRPSAALGASWYDASGQSTWDRDLYIDSEIRTAAAASMLLLVAKLTDGDQGEGGLGLADGYDDGDEYGNRSFKIGHSPHASVIGKDEELELLSSDRPNPNAASFLKVIDRDTASAHGISYYRLTGDYEATNFTSARAAKIDEDDHVRPLQQWFAHNVALRVRREHNLLAAATGRYKTIRAATFNQDPDTFQRFDAVGNGRQLLDPFKEGEARTARLRTGISTFKEECAASGKHWIRVLLQRAIEDRITQSLGVTLDYTKAGNALAPTPENGAAPATETTGEDLAEAADLFTNGD